MLRRVNRNLTYAEFWKKCGACILNYWWFLDFRALWKPQTRQIKTIIRTERAFSCTLSANSRSGSESGLQWRITSPYQTVQIQTTTVNWLQIRPFLCSGYRSQLEIWQWIRTAVAYHFPISDCADRQTTTVNWLQIRPFLCSDYRSQLEIWQWIRTAVAYHFRISDCADRQTTTENWLQIRPFLCSGYSSQVSACSFLYGSSVYFLQL